MGSKWVRKMGSNANEKKYPGLNARARFPRPYPLLIYTRAYPWEVFAQMAVRCWQENYRQTQRFKLTVVFWLFFSVQKLPSETPSKNSAGAAGFQRLGNHTMRIKCLAKGTARLTMGCG